MPSYDRAEPSSGVLRTLGVAGMVIMLVLCLGLVSCGLQRVKPDAGSEAVLVEKPMLFGHGGVDDTPVSTGSEWIAWTTQPVYVNMQPEQHLYEVNDLMSSNGIPLAFNAAIRLQVTDSVALIKRFGPRWYENNVAVEFASELRQAVRQHDMNSLAIEATGVDEVDRDVTANMKRYLAGIHMPVQLVKVTAGKATPPKEILDQRTETAAQVQRKLTEDSTKLAEDARKNAETSRALADNAYRQTLGLDPREFVDLQRINMQEKVCAASDAHCTFIIGNGTPVVNTK